MNRYLVLGLSTLLSLLLVGCTTNRNPYPNSDLSNEKWRANVETDQYAWNKGADNWFLRGDANTAELQNRNAPYSEVISTIAVRVPDDFTRIQMNGSFQVQIFGTYEHNTVYLYGPNAAVREIAVNVRGNTLSLQQSSNAPRSMRNAIVRIGIRNLSELNQLGCSSASCGSIEGVRINSNGLVITAAGSGNIYLTGSTNLKRVTQTGMGTVTVFGTSTPALDIMSSNRGTVNVSGTVGVKSIVHHGSGDVNIIGALTNNLMINSDGSGKVGVSGSYVNVHDVQAKGYTHVFVTGTASGTLNVYTYDRACVGMSGRADQLYVYSSGSSRFFGRSLIANDAFVRGSDSAHINVNSNNRMFAAVTGSGSIYFFGTPKNISQFVSNNGVIIPIWSDNNAVYAPSPYKDEGAVVVNRNYGRGYRQSYKG